MNSNAQSSARLGRDWIASRIPHQGGMCLLDFIDSWTEEQIICHTRSHLLPDNPLRSADRLGIVNGIEYAAQAMAVHGALQGTSKASGIGYLTSVREVSWHSEVLDRAEGTLVVRAERISGSDISLLYQFELVDDIGSLISGRAGVLLDANFLGKKS